MEIHGFKNANIRIPLHGAFSPPKEEAPSFQDHLVLGGKDRGDDGGLIRLNILHMNDIHGAVEPMMDPKISPDSPVGGLANSKTLIDREKAKNPDGTLLLNAGDIAEGSLVSYVTKGQVVVDALKDMGFDAAALGNHDFAWGQNALNCMIQGMDTPILAANVTRTEDGRVMDGAKPYLIQDVKGVKVGIIGLDTPAVGHFVDEAKLKGLQFNDGASTISRYLPEVKEKGADLVVVLSHMGFEEDKKLARDVKGIDVIVGGHSHTELKEGHREGDTLIVQAGSLTRFVGNLQLDVDPATRKIVSHQARLIPVIAKEIEPDPQIQAILKPYLAEAEKIGAVVMGEATEDLHYAHREACKLNQIHADSIREKTGAEVGICNSRTLRGHVPKGPITYRQLYSALPFTEENYVTCRAKGSTILQEIEDDLRDGATELAVPTGLKYQYDPSRPEGRRVTSIVTADGRPLDMDKEYSLVLNETMAKKKTFKDVKDRKVHGGVQQVFFDYVKAGSPWQDNPDDRVVPKAP
jgi:2',3'-cyclic-nucleotide 2'-phosphodiesterase (5'-nucleotidase family)